MWYRRVLQSSDAAITALSQHVYEIDLATALGNVVITVPSTGFAPLYFGVLNNPDAGVGDGSKVIIIQDTGLVELGRISAAGESMWFGLGDTGQWQLLAHSNPSEYQWTWANAAARLATQASAAQINAVGFQSDLGAAYRLLSDSPLRFGQLPYPDVAAWRPIFGTPGSSINPLGVGGSITFGSQAGVSPTSTNTATQLIRTGLATSALPTNIAVYRATAGNAPLSVTGLRYRFQFTLSVVAASWRWFVGLGVNAFAANVDPAGQVNLFGIGRGNAEANVQLYRSNAAGPATQVDLGASFPAATADTAYDLELFFPAGGATAVMQLYNLGTGAEVSESHTVNIPTSTSALLWQFYLSNNTDAVAVNIGIGNMLQGQLYR